MLFQLLTVTWATENVDGEVTDSHELGGGLSPSSEPLASLMTPSGHKALLGAA